MGLQRENEIAMVKHSTGVASASVGAPHTGLMSIVVLLLPTLPHQLSWVITTLTKIGPAPSLPRQTTITFCMTTTTTMTSGLLSSRIFPSPCVSCGGSSNHHSPQLYGSRQHGYCTMVPNPSSPFPSFRPDSTLGYASGDSSIIVPASVTNAVTVQATATSVQTGGALDRTLEETLEKSSLPTPPRSQEQEAASAAASAAARLQHNCRPGRNRRQHCEPTHHQPYQHPAFEAFSATLNSIKASLMDPRVLFGNLDKSKTFPIIWDSGASVSLSFD
jgi:hypothetical protein